MEAVEEFTKIESHFIRGRNALMVSGSFSAIYTDYYLHLMDNKLRHKEQLDTLLKEQITFLTLHLVARPWAETIAWTVNLRAPRVNIFVTGGSTEESITGHLFTEGVKEGPINTLHSQTLVTGAEGRRSSIELEDNDPAKWIETFYQQSEQRPARAFRLPDEKFVLIAAQPDCDLEWLNELTDEKVASMLDDEPHKLLETRRFRFHCGCSPERFLPSLAQFKSKPEELFQGDPAVEINCPRCGAKHILTPDMFEDDSDK